MLKIALVYGVISGTIVIISMIFGIVSSDGKGFYASEYFGYLIMLIALSMIFIGIKRYRDLHLGGIIKFLPALGLGVAIAAIAGVMYVFVWELYSMSTDYAFIASYTDGLIEAKKAEGISGAALEKIIADAREMEADYHKFYIRLPMTFVEIFPVGLIISIVSAALLRNPKLLPARK